MNVPCDQIRPRLDDFLSHELPDDVRAQVELHLEGCPQCRAALEARARVRQQLRTAVRAMPVPGDLEARVRGAMRAGPRTGVYAVAAAALIIICVFLWNMARAKRDPIAAILAKTPGRLATVLNVGLVDHLNCAVFRKYSKQPLPAKEMAADLGARYAGLLPLIQAKLPANFQVLQAHLCDVHGRQYTHFIIYGGRKLISVILTRAQPDEWLETGIYQAGVDRFQVVGFESSGYLAYVISDLDAQQNLQWAANLAPTVRQYLATHASG